MAEMEADLERFREECGKEKGLRDELANVKASLGTVREEMGEERRLRLLYEDSFTLLDPLCTLLNTRCRVLE
eukprot:8881303-Prorocentrum_lima.AAC.1